MQTYFISHGDWITFPFQIEESYKIQFIMHILQFTLAFGDLVSIVFVPIVGLVCPNKVQSDVEIYTA